MIFLRRVIYADPTRETRAEPYALIVREDDETMDHFYAGSFRMGKMDHSAKGGGRGVNCNEKTMGGTGQFMI